MTGVGPAMAACAALSVAVADGVGVRVGKGMIIVCPARSASGRGKLFARRMASTVVPSFKAMLPSVSFGCTVYCTLTGRGVGVGPEVDVREGLDVPVGATLAIGGAGET